VIEVYRAASLIGSGSSGTDGGWALTVSAPLADGEHQLEIRAVDAAGNRSAPRATDIRIDTAAPVRPVLDPVSSYQNKAQARVFRNCRVRRARGVAGRRG